MFPNTFRRTLRAGHGRECSRPPRAVITAALLSVCLLACPGPRVSASARIRAAAQTKEWLDLVKTFGKGVKKGLEALEQIRKINEAIENNRTPDPNPTDAWSDLAERYRSATAQVEQFPVVEDFDAAAYRVSADELSNCATRKGALAKSTDYLRKLDEVNARAQEAHTTFRDASEDLGRSDEALRYLSEVYPKVSNLPVYGRIFQWNWLDIEANVRPALARLRSAVNRHLTKLEAEQARMRLQVSNLRDNLRDFESLPCTLEGREWKGVWVWERDNATPARVPLDMTVTFTNSGGVYGAKVAARNDAQHVNYTGIAQVTPPTAERVVEYVMQRVRFRGTISTDYLSMEGQAYRDGRNIGNFTLKRPPQPPPAPVAGTGVPRESARTAVPVPENQTSPSRLVPAPPDGRIALLPESAAQRLAPLSPRVSETEVTVSGAGPVHTAGLVNAAATPRDVRAWRMFVPADVARRIRELTTRFGAATPPRGVTQPALFPPGLTGRLSASGRAAAAPNVDRLRRRGRAAAGAQGAVPAGTVAPGPRQTNLILLPGQAALSRLFSAVLDLAPLSPPNLTVTGRR